MITVNGHTYVPSELKWSQMDISQADSGRDSTGYMYKNQVKKNKKLVKKVKLELTFKGLDWAKASQIVNDFDPEYFSVNYPDIKQGRYVTKDFYCGDKSSEFYIWTENKKILSSVTFNIIER